MESKLVFGTGKNIPAFILGEQASYHAEEDIAPSIMLLAHKSLEKSSQIDS